MDRFSIIGQTTTNESGDFESLLVHLHVFKVKKTKVLKLN